MHIASLFRVVVFISLIAGFTLAHAQENSQAHAGPVKWLTIQEAEKLSMSEKRLIFIDVYTDWCGWCKVMDKNTFADPEVARILNEKFYPVKFNAEQRADVALQGNIYKFVPYGNGGTHELASALLQNRLSYPTVVFLDEEFKMIQPLPGYQKAPEFHRIIQFLGEGHFRKMKWAEWQNIYKSPYPASGGGR
jgi:thioredoxin-related protein